MVDYPAAWNSGKLKNCSIEARREWLWVYGLADCNGSFEMTDLSDLWFRVAPIRPDLTKELFCGYICEYQTHGLLFTWERNGKRYGHWTKSEEPGRLPPKKTRNRYTWDAPVVPQKELKSYVNKFPSSKIAGGRRSRLNRDSVEDESGLGLGSGLGSGLGEGLGEGKGAPAFRALTDWLIKTFQETIGKKPTWGKKDYVALAKLKKDNPDLTDNEIKIRFISFLDSNTTWLQGWQLWKFCKDFDSFIDGPVIRPPTQQEIAEKDAAVGRGPR
jgi:hypothetical protein